MKLDKNYKVRVTPEQSREIQELVFKLGGNLQSGDTSVKETHLEHLYVSKCLKMSFGLTEHGWSYQEGATIQADDLIALLTDLSKSAENPPQKMELTPDFETEASEPKFNVGNKVYLFGTNYIEEITKIIGANVYLAGADFDASVSVKEICHATPENHALLSKLYPHIEFEQPPKPLSGDELVRAMLKKGIKNVLCLWVNGDKIVIDGLDYKGALVNINNNIVSGLTPIDWCTGEPLTQAVLDE